MRRLKMLMDAEGLPFDEGRHMTFNSRLAQELAKWGEGKPESERLKSERLKSERLKSERLNMALYRAYFVEGQNISDVEVLMHVVKQVGLPVDEAREMLEQRLMRSAVDADWQYARSIGVTAVPTFAVGLTGIVGAQPYEQLAHFLEHVGTSRR
jgi:predicted DsbA family dithiol-disulfide isomerase